VVPTAANGTYSDLNAGSAPIAELEKLQAMLEPTISKTSQQELRQWILLQKDLSFPLAPIVLSAWMGLILSGVKLSGRVSCPIRFGKWLALL
jgi:hypothetical protein